MVKIVWAVLLIGGTVLGLINGNIELMTETILDSAQNAVSLCISMIGMNCLFLGLLHILETSGAAEWLAGKMGKSLSTIFPETNPKSKAMQYIALNMITNMFGIGNAATPYGLKAMEALQEVNMNKEVASDAMCMFALMNTASVQILPLSVITLRAAAGSLRATDIVLPCFVVTVATAIFAVAGGILCRRHHE